MVMSLAEVELGIGRLSNLVAKLEGFDPSTITDRWGGEVTALKTSIDATLADVFGYRSEDYLRYSVAKEIDRAGHTSRRGGIPIADIQAGFQSGKARALSVVRDAIATLEDRKRSLARIAATTQATPRENTSPNKVFVVHGHDDAAKVETWSLIERAGLDAVVLHEQPNSGRTIIEKFEGHGSAAGFAVVLLTPDDVGGEPGFEASKLRCRARQNVIAEMGWFAGKLGRERVCVLKKGDVEIPSDFHGVLYTDMDDRGAWRTQLLRELHAAGYSVDWEKALT